jgi:hypothetical protein
VDGEGEGAAPAVVPSSTSANPSTSFAPAATTQCQQCASDHPADYVCTRDGLTYENACYAICWGASDFAPGPCLPPVDSLAADAMASAPRGSKKGEYEAAPPAPSETPAVAATLIDPIEEYDTSAPLPPNGGPKARFRRASASRRTRGGSGDNAASSTTPATVTQPRIVTPRFIFDILFNTGVKLVVQRQQCRERADVWVAASWVPPGGTAFVTKGWWRVRQRRCVFWGVVVEWVGVSIITP